MFQKKVKKLTKKQSKKAAIDTTYSCEDCNIKFKVSSHKAI